MITTSEEEQLKLQAIQMVMTFHASEEAWKLLLEAEDENEMQARGFVCWQIFENFPLTDLKEIVKQFYEELVIAFELGANR